MAPGIDLQGALGCFIAGTAVAQMPGDLCREGASTELADDSLAAAVFRRAVQVVDFQICTEAGWQEGVFDGRLLEFCFFLAVDEPFDRACQVLVFNARTEAALPVGLLFQSAAGRCRLSIGHATGDDIDWPCSAQFCPLRFNVALSGISID
ncbi:hypothetical protein D3C80_871480 [compost metagenome]